MKKHIPLIAASLLISLFIYVFFRTEKTLVNQVFIALFSRQSYLTLKTSITTLIPLQDYVIYSLPEGLWVFCITITSSFFYIELRKRRWSLVFIPILLAVFMELFQLLHFTNGRFDWMDIVFAVGFWVLALLYTRTNHCKEPLFQSFNTRAILCMTSYSIVFLAHVVY